MNSNLNFHPQVSIVIPVYNGANYIREAIESALNQTYDNIEIIVVNDGSNDNTEEIIASYGERIRYVSKQNSGVSSALNRGIQEMNGEYFSWLSHDDKYKPEKIEHQVELVGLTGCSVALCGADTINAASEVIRKSSPIKGLLDGQKNSWKSVLPVLYNHGCFGGCSLLISRDVFQKTGFFNEKLRFIQDLDMWTRMFLSGYDLAYSVESDVQYRVHPNQVTQRRFDLFRCESKEVSDDTISEILQTSENRKEIFLSYCFYHAKYNNVDIIQRAVQKAKELCILDFCDYVKLFAMLLYGSVRPFVRNMFYRILLKTTKD